MNPECSSHSTKKREERAGGQAVGVWKATGPVTAATTRGTHRSPASFPRDQGQRLQRGAEKGTHFTVGVGPVEQCAFPSGVTGHGAGGPERMREPAQPLLTGDSTRSSARKVPPGCSLECLWPGLPGDRTWTGPSGCVILTGRALSQILERSQ